MEFQGAPSLGCKSFHEIIPQVERRNAVSAAGVGCTEEPLDAEIQ